MGLDNQQAIRSFWGGFFDAEGWESESVCKGKHRSPILGLTNTRVEIIEKFVSFLKNAGIHVSITRRKRKKHHKIQYQLTISGRRQVERMRRLLYSVKLGSGDMNEFWLLGFLDGGGNVGIYQNNDYSRKRRRKKSLKLKPTISFFSTDERIRDRAIFFLRKNRLPFHVSSTSKGRKKRKWKIQILGLKRCRYFLDHFLEKDFGYKRRHLEILNAFINSRLTRPKKSPYSEEELFLVERLKSLND